MDYFEGVSWQLSADYSVSAALSVKAALNYNRIAQDNNQYDDETYSSIDNPLIPNSYKLRNTGITRGVSLQPRWDLGSAGVLTLGLSGEWDSWRDSGLVKPGGSGAAQGGHGVGGGSPPYIPQAVSDDKDLFISSTALQYEVSPVKGLGLSSGVAYHVQVRDEATPSDYSVSLSGYYDLSQDTRFKAAFQRNIRFPSLSQLYLKDSANPNLAPETVYHYQLGVEQKLPGQSLFKLDGFLSNLHNVIVLNQNVTPAQNANFSLYRFYGFEGALESHFVPKLALKAGYTFNQSRDLSGVGRDEVQYVPRDKVTLSGKYDFDFGLTPFASLIYLANSYVYTKQQVATVGKAKMADYCVVNLKLSQKLYHDRISLYVGADNLFNFDYEDSYGIPRPGRFIYGGFEYRFSI